MPHNLPRVLRTQPVTSKSRFLPIVSNTNPVTSRTVNAPFHRNPLLVETKSDNETKQICNELLGKNKELVIENEKLNIKISQLLEAIEQKDFRARIDTRAGAHGFQQPLQETIQAIPSAPGVYLENYKLKLIRENQELNNENRRLQHEKERLRQEWVNIKSFNPRAASTSSCFFY